MDLSPGALRRNLGTVRGRLLAGRDWGRRGYDMPAPQNVKWAVLDRYGLAGGNWIETGTFLGDTTDFLSRRAAHVWSIEPEPSLAARAVKRFAADPRVTIINGSSEDRLEEVLASVPQGPLSFWLDGHYSAGMTYQGDVDTPIRHELGLIEKHLSGLRSGVVLVDDVRCFDPANPMFATYPPREWLVEWAVRNGLRWTIEHDIFVAQR